jgi:hypothetical protein
MDQNRSKAVMAYERMLVRLALERREASAWEEMNLLEALVAMISGDHQGAIDFIAAAERRPTAAEVEGMEWRPHAVLSWAEIRDRFDELRGVTLFHELMSRGSAKMMPAMSIISASVAL